MAQEKKVVVSYQDVKTLYKELGLEEPDKFAREIIKLNFGENLTDWMAESCEILTRRTGKTTYDILYTLAKHKITDQPIMVRAQTMWLATEIAKTMQFYAVKLGLKPKIKTASMNPSSIRGFAGIIYTDHTARPI
jgi:hypothetical protein